MFQASLIDIDHDVKPVSPDRAIAFSQYFSGQSMLVENSLTSIIGANDKACSRVTEIGDIVDCYRNLNKTSLFSLKQRYGALKGKVSGYARSVVLRNPEFVTSESSRQRVLLEKSRNVHSYVRGEFAFSNDGDVILSRLKNHVRVSYSPYIAGYFFTLERDEQCVIIKESIKPFVGAGEYGYAIINGKDVFLCNL
jgi:hypothetical protein